MAFGLVRGERIPRGELLARLVALQYRRNDEGFARGCFRVRGDCSATRSIPSSSSIR
jgi:excinuclease ABC subunit B